HPLRGCAHLFHLRSAHVVRFTSTLRSPECARNVRVGANSPSLCPTICSVTKTGTCLRPSWTAIVCPTISGKIVEVRDQVRIMFFDPEAFIASMRLNKRSSTKGPFFDDLLMRLPIHPSEAPGLHKPWRKCTAFWSPFLLAAATAADDQAVGFLVLRAGALAERRHAPRGHGVAAALRLALAAAVRVVDGVHRGPADGRARAPPSATAGLSAGDVLVVDDAHLADGRAAGERDAAQLSRGEAQDAVALV